MALGDLKLLDPTSQGSGGGHLYNVAAGTPIYAGDPVQRFLGNSTGKVVFPAITSTPVVATDFYVGVATTSSTNTTSAAGTVNVIPLNSSQVWLVTPDAPTSWDTQAEYDALVGARVLLKNSVSVTSTPAGGTYTLLASDSSSNGCVVQTLDVFKYPGKVAFSFRAGASDLT